MPMPIRNIVRLHANVELELAGTGKDRRLKLIQNQIYWNGFRMTMSTYNPNIENYSTVWLHVTEKFEG